MGRPQDSVIETELVDGTERFTGGPLGTGRKELIRCMYKWMINWRGGKLQCKNELALSEKCNTLYRYIIMQGLVPSERVCIVMSALRGPWATVYAATAQ